MDFKEKYLSWLNDDYFDEQTRTELSGIADDKEIEDRFFKDLEFGTGGMRGVIGAGTNRLNIYTISKATQGLANYILKSGKKDKGVVIAFDSRRYSPLFAKTAALVLNGNGIKTYLFDSLRPTPILSFAVRYLGCVSGIVVTASHNPPEYNGYKVYWEDGGQVPYPMDDEIIKEVNSLASFKEVKKAEEGNPLFHTAGKDVDDKYVESVLGELADRGLVQKSGGDITVVYTPLHGSGNIPVRRVLKEAGFTKVEVVKEQEDPDENFPTVKYPNPEEPASYELGKILADKIGADVILATDPDSDRIGIAVKHRGEYVTLTGNNIGVLLANYLITRKKLPKNPAIVSTIVSTDMTKAIAKENGADYYEVLTGFKYIGEKIKEFEISGKNTFVFGFEESYGALAGTYARDKDAVVAAALLCESALYYKKKNLTLVDALEELYKKYGYYKEAIQSITLKGVDGIAKIKSAMNNLRENPPRKIRETIKISSVKDYLKGVDGLPVSDVLYFSLEDGSWFCARPSGTEPKLKIYFGVVSDTDEKAREDLEKLKSYVLNYMGFKI
jgi:phosphoglucomutase